MSDELVCLVSVSLALQTIFILLVFSQMYFYILGDFVVKLGDLVL